MTVLSKRVRDERKKQGWSQLKMALALELTRVTVSHIENGKKLGPVVIKALSRYFNISTREIRKEMLTEYEDNK